MDLLFLKRKRVAEKEYKDAVENTNLAGMMVNYRNILFNPLKLKPHEIIGCVELEPDTEEAKALNRYIRLLNEVDTADGYLTYILNFCNSIEEFEHILESAPLTIKEARLHIFMEENQDKILFLKRMRILSECIT